MNVIEGALGYLTSGGIQKASALVGESPAATRRGLETAVRATVAGLAAEASQPGGARRILPVLSSAGLDGPPESVSARLGAASGEELVALGKDLLGSLFGGRMGGVVDAAAAATGVKPASMGTLLGLATPLVMGALGSAVHARHLDAAGLAGLLGAQRSVALSTLPPAVAAALPGPPAAHDASDQGASRPAPAPAPRSPARFWPLLLAIPLAILGGLFFRRPTVGPAREWVPRARLGAGVEPRPGPPVVAPDQAAAPQATAGPTVLPEGAMGQAIAEFLASPGGEASQRFAFDDLGFEHATANLMPRALTALDEVAAVLATYPTATIAVEGHTDSTGVPDQNQALSVARAEAVKSALVARGVAADRVTTAGFGQDRPIASNDSAEGRARNRRTEILVNRR